MQLTGFHHLTAVTADAPRNHAFYTQTLGLRLVKKTVNQDDVSAYHLFYADGLASPGTDITFFDWPVDRERRGTHSVVRTGLRVDGAESLAWWEQRFAALGVPHGKIADRDGRPTLDFEDFEGQRLSLVADETKPAGNPWAKSPVPAEHQIRGLGPITLSVPNLQPTDVVLTKVMNLVHVREYSVSLDDTGGSPRAVHVYRMGGDGAQAELHVRVDPGARPFQPSIDSAGTKAMPCACATGSQVIWPAQTFSPARRCTSSCSARRQPLSASASTKGRVTLFSAKVEVRATAPGMLATQ